MKDTSVERYTFGDDTNVIAASDVDQSDSSSAQFAEKGAMSLVSGPPMASSAIGLGIATILVISGVVIILRIRRIKMARHATRRAYY